jgi:hypothetical protein
MPHLSTIERFTIVVLFDFDVVVEWYVYVVLYSMIIVCTERNAFLIKRSERASTTKRQVTLNYLLFC